MRRDAAAMAGDAQVAVLRGRPQADPKQTDPGRPPQPMTERHYLYQDSFNSDACQVFWASSTGVAEPVRQALQSRKAPPDVRLASTCLFEGSLGARLPAAWDSMDCSLQRKYRNLSVAAIEAV